MVKKYRYVNTANKKPESADTGDKVAVVEANAEKEKTTIMVRYYSMTNCFMHDTIVIGTEKQYIDSHIANRDSLPLFDSNAECLYYGIYKDIEDMKVSDICDRNLLLEYIKTHS